MHILIVDDEKNIRKTLSDILSDEGYNVITADSGEKGLKILQNRRIELMFLDVKLPGIDGIEVLKRTKEILPALDIVMISGHSSIRTAVKAVRIGAYDFLEKPLSLHKVNIAAKHISDKIRLYKKYEQTSENVSKKYKMIGNSVAFQKVRNMIDRVSKTDSKVLIRGESGTGKELVAYTIHNQSQRKNESFVKFNSAAIPTELVESELFGHEKGAFTGADKKRIGKLEQADKGSLFLDEIGDMNLRAQAKILRVIQEGTFERVGSNKTLSIDVRIIAATNKDLEKMTEEGEFREDLFYRLNVIPINIPALRKRKSDISILLNYFSEYFAVELKMEPKKFSEEAIDYLKNYEFPGNVRELRNLVERMYILTDQKIIDKDAILPNIKQQLQPKGKSYPFLKTQEFSKAKEEFEKYYLKKHLEKHNWKITDTAKELGLQQSNLSRKIKKLGITR
ncbi:MAG: sigma-54-dependent Fis family transcriptional regulator [Candidatus Cloacimonetes bacterium]|nr:sigma-54-dependent Fis family transcriptional regulator [Candidatus Cloacimonadota bacterium]MBS3766704.1 sigma-54-dependent Fis family transcriptional regulator [Candidatus Cloacimonadota bacterium]